MKVKTTEEIYQDCLKTIKEHNLIIPEEWIDVEQLTNYLENEIDETLNESGNNCYDEGYVECCKKLIKIIYSNYEVKE